MRATPLPSADRRLPRMRLPPLALLVIGCSFVRVCHGLSRCAGRPAAVPTRLGTGPASHRSRRAAGGGDGRTAAALAGEPRQARLPAAPADAAIPPAEQSAAALPAPSQLPDRQPKSQAWSAGSRPLVPAGLLP